MRTVYAMFLLAALVLSGCRQDGIATGLVGEDPPWTVERSGEALPKTVINLRRGPSHCDWHSALVLNVGWPLGTPRTVYGTGQVREYVRDPQKVPPEMVGVQGDLQSDAPLPEDARYTGFRKGDLELWLRPVNDPAFAYLVKGERLKRGPTPRMASYAVDGRRSTTAL